MSRLGTLALAALLMASPALLMASPALAQGIAESGPANPLGAGRDAPEVGAEPAWAGTFAHEGVEASFRPTTDDPELFEGTITVDGRPFRARGAAFEDDGVIHLEGGLLADGAEFKFNGELRGQDDLVLESNGQRYTLRRVGQRDERRAGGGQVQQRERDRRGHADVGHVRVGQVFVFRGQPGSETRWTVREVTPDVVRYDAQVIMDRGDGPEPIAEAIPCEYPLANGTRFVTEEGVQRGEITISDVRFDCIVMSADGTQTWVPVSGDVPTFPGAIRTMQDGTILQELVRIDAPGQRARDDQQRAPRPHGGSARSGEDRR